MQCSQSFKYAKPCGPHLKGCFKRIKLQIITKIQLNFVVYLNAREKKNQKICCFFQLAYISPNPTFSFPVLM